MQYTETQSMAYTADNGSSWVKLSFPDANPVIADWPAGFDTTGYVSKMKSLPASATDASCSFRYPFVFKSPVLTALLANTTSLANASGDYFLTISGGVRPDLGGRLYLYRQTNNEVRPPTLPHPLPKRAR